MGAQNVDYPEMAKVPAKSASVGQGAPPITAEASFSALTEKTKVNLTGLFCWCHPSSNHIGKGRVTLSRASQSS